MSSRGRSDNEGFILIPWEEMFEDQLRYWLFLRSRVTTTSNCQMLHHVLIADIARGWVSLPTCERLQEIEVPISRWEVADAIIAFRLPYAIVPPSL
jgi:hypothetical protein